MGSWSDGANLGLAGRDGLRVEKDTGLAGTLGNVANVEHLLAGCRRLGGALSRVSSSEA